MLIVCIMITTLNPTPAVKQREAQSWQRGNNREATGEGKSSLPNPTTLCMTQSLMKPEIHHFWGEMKIVTLPHRSLPGAACCPAQRGVHGRGEHGQGQLCPWLMPMSVLLLQLSCQPAPHSICTAHSYMLTGARLPPQNQILIDFDN